MLGTAQPSPAGRACVRAGCAGRAAPTLGVGCQWAPHRLRTPPHCAPPLPPAAALQGLAARELLVRAAAALRAWFGWLAPCALRCSPCSPKASASPKLP